MKNSVIIFSIVSLLVYLPARGDSSYPSDVRIKYEQENNQLMMENSRLLGVQVLQEIDDIKKFDAEFDAIFSKFDPVEKNENQDPALAKGLAEFCSKYTAKFPVGHLRNIITEDIHISPGCNHAFGDSKAKINEKSREYSLFCEYVLFLSKSLYVSRRDSEKKLAMPMLKVYVLLKNETSNDGICSLWYYRIRDGVKASRLCSDFIAKYPEFSEMMKAASKSTFYDDVRGVEKAMDVVARQQGEKAISDSQRKLILDAFRKAESSCLSPFCPLVFQYNYIRLIWIMRNASISSKDQASLDVTADLLGDIQQKTASETVKRWAREAMDSKNISRHIPRRTWTGTVVVEHGKLVGVDDDGDGKIDRPYDPKDYE